MILNGQAYTNSTIEEINSLVKAEPGISRRELSRRFCEANDWRSPNGELKDMSFRKVLAELERRQLINLPPAKQIENFHKESLKPVQSEEPSQELHLKDLGPLSVEPITDRRSDESRMWRFLLEKYHPLEATKLCGAQIRYLITSEHYGPLGALAFNSASFSLKARDEYIGWGPRAKRANLDKIVQNSRFLLIPTLKVANLASYVLALALERLGSDWLSRYNVAPVLVETFVNPDLYRGTSYQACNWRYIGQTAGRRDGQPKDIYLYPLSADWQEGLCQAPQKQFGEIAPVETPQNWAEEEFSTAHLYDPRLKSRLYQIAQDFFDNCEKNIPEACGNKSRTIAAYRFFQNKEVTMEAIVDAHTEATIERIKDHSVVLAPQDTTTLDYSTHPMTEGLGPTNGVEHQSLGLILHDTLAFSEQGVPLGVLDAQCWARDHQDKGKSTRRKELPLEQKESSKWLHSFQKVAQIQEQCRNTTLVSIGDREADIHELFCEAVQMPNAPKLLVRAEKSRKRKLEEKKLWEHMAELPVAGAIKIHIPRRGSRKAREPEVELRFDRVTLQPPQDSQKPPVQLWAVYLTERYVEEGITPVEWMLLTTAPVENFSDAQKRVEWYAARWGIEVYHRTLKSGCRIKNRQLQKADHLEACLGIDMVVAWRVYHLTMLGRETPDLPCTVFFKDFEWKALCIYVSKNPTPPEEPPSLIDAIYMVAGIGGFMGRRGHNFPGTQTMWRGLQNLERAAEMYWIINSQGVPPPLY